MNEILKELRISEGLSQGEVALILEVDQATYSRWEAGKGQITAKALVRACLLYKVSPEYILSPVFEEERKKWSFSSASL